MDSKKQIAPTAGKFDRVMKEPARYRREGGVFDGKVVRFRYRRKVMTALSKKMTGQGSDAWFLCSSYDLL